MWPKASSKTDNKETKEMTIERVHNLRATFESLCAARGELKCPLRLDAREMRPEFRRSVDVRERVDSVSCLLGSHRNCRRRKLHSTKRRFHTGGAIRLRSDARHPDSDRIS